MSDRQVGWCRSGAQHDLAEIAPRLDHPVRPGRALVADALPAEGLKLWHHVVLSGVRDLAPLSAAERDQFMGLLIRISGTDG
ncbi:hypothetical protein ACFWP5_41610 [Streptomyces sp. NPDC058469]|uniref:hypothetical protein n=1 Tax=Streptomyces sp. NPDC058469 TaxID=3346514 RepID=UPI0036568D66